MPLIDVYNEVIVETKNVFSNNFCEQMINFFESSEANRHAGILNENTLNKKLKSTTDVHINNEGSSIQRYLYSTILKVVNEKKKDYIKLLKDKGIDKFRMGSNNWIQSIKYAKAVQTGPVIQKYGPGDFFDWHSDYIYDRYLGWILYLNDVSPENGGATLFNSGRVIKPERGKLLIFPSEQLFLHKGETVKNGYKYIATGFFSDSYINNTFPFIVK